MTDALEARRRAILDELGVTAYRRRGSAAGAVRSATDEPAAAPRVAPPPGPDWPELAAAVAGCTLCALHRTRTHTVFGTGDRQARLLVVGEAPGAEEDRQGEPFVGRAGQLLNSMLRAAGFARAEVYIANVLKCRPPDNRDPNSEEAALCLPYLRRQIELVRPRVLLCVGRIAAQRLLGVETPLARLRGQVHELGGVPVVVTYHPAYLLRSPTEKRKAWTDLQLALRLLGDGDRT
ncbi:MAG: uracil-DNA glycosylase [Gammaproteobacteria bacterium]|nr:uracil-DNA glycosylase [Gammaproteobacteria bacterium]